MNTTPCGRCSLYDPLVGPNAKNTHMGWCMKRSKYPYREGPGQHFPDGVNRVSEGALAQPFIVKDRQVVGPCTFAKPTTEDLFKKKVGETEARSVVARKRQVVKVLR